MAAYTGSTTELSNSKLSEQGPRTGGYAGAVDAFAARIGDTNYSDGYTDGQVVGYVDGELYGFSSNQETNVKVIKPGETDNDKKTIYLRIYDSTGLPASGLVGEGSVCVPGAAEKQVNRDSAGFSNAAGTFTHVGDGLYKYIFDDAEVAEAGGEGTSIFRVKVTGFRTSSADVAIRYGTDAIRSDVSGVSTKLGTPAGASVSDDISDVKSDTSLLPAAMPKIDALYQIGIGRWKIQGTQLLLYDSDNTTVLFSFNLKDVEGNASATSIFERTPTP